MKKMKKMQMSFQYRLRHSMYNSLRSIIIKFTMLSCRKSIIITQEEAKDTRLGDLERNIKNHRCKSQRKPLELSPMSPLVKPLRLKLLLGMQTKAILRFKLKSNKIRIKMPRFNKPFRHHLYKLKNQLSKRNLRRRRSQLSKRNLRRLRNQLSKRNWRR